MWSARGRTWETDGVELVGLQPLSAQDLYEFALEDGLRSPTYMMRSALFRRRPVADLSYERQRTGGPTGQDL